MRVFDFDPAEHAADYRANGWVHIRSGITPELHASLLELSRRELGDHMLEGFAIKGKKEQALYEFPDSVDYGELYDVVAALCGLNRATMTLSERHIQAYEPHAAPEPPAHKDRLPSQVSVGLSIDIPEESELVLYPHDHRELNPFNTSAGLRRSLAPEQLPEVVLKGAREVAIKDQARDVVLFPGSTTWHLRRNAARAINLYLKFNDFDCDPLGEDPATPARRAASMEALGAPGADLDALIPVLSRRLDTVARKYTRASWHEVLEAQVFGEEPFGITPRQLDALRAVDGRTALGAIVVSLSADGDGTRARPDVLRLVEHGALDLLADVPAAVPRQPSGSVSAEVA